MSPQPKQKALQLNFRNPSPETDALCCLISLREVLVVHMRYDPTCNLIQMLDRTLARYQFARLT